MNKKYIIGGLIIIGIVAGLFLPRGNTVVERVVEKLGADPGPDKYEHQFFYSNFTAGQRFSTSTSATTSIATLTSSEFRKILETGYADITVNRIETSLRLPATSTVASVLPIGGRVEVLFRNATSTAGADFRLVAGTGFTVQVASTTPAITASTTPGEWAMATFIRKNNTDIDVLYNHFK